MASVLDLPLIQYVGIVLELLLYGVYTVLFAATVWVLRTRRRETEGRSKNRVIDICSWFIFVTITIHCASTLYLTYDGFLVLGTNPLGQLLYFADEGTDVALVREAMYGLSALGMEIMLIYRLWVIWGRSWMVIAVPTVLVVFDFAGFVICLHGSSHHASAAFAHMSVDVLEPILFFCEAFTNLFCAALITLRIIRNSALGYAGSLRGRGLEPILWIIAESAAVYTSLSIVVAVGLLMKQPFVFALLDVIPPVAGINSCLLHVRIGLTMATDRSPLGTPGFRFDDLELKVSATRHGRMSRNDHGLRSKEHDRGVDDLEPPDTPRTAVETSAFIHSQTPARPHSSV